MLQLRSCSRAVRYVLAALLFVCSGARAEIKLPKVFSDNMVLQQELPVPVWGWAAAGETVTVELDGREASAKADDTGKWRVDFGPMGAGGPHVMTVTGSAAPGNRVAITNVLIGEVWLCSGQSNMDVGVNMSSNAAAEIAAADYPSMRLFTVKRYPSRTVQQDVLSGEWVSCSFESVPAFSAVGYYFGREVCRNLKVPVGLIQASVGATPAEAWTSQEALEADAELKKLLDLWAEWTDKYNASPVSTPEYQNNQHEANQAWKKLRNEATAKHRQGERIHIPPAPPTYFNPYKSPHRPTTLFNSMIAPLIPYAIRGAVWYQGESNSRRAWQYQRLFPVMIADWRERWGQGDFPFLYVQLASCRRHGLWPELREAQTMTLAVPNTAMAVAIDIGESNEIHPRNKQEVGRRLFLGALAKAYGRDVVYSGPLYDGMKVEGKHVRLTFKHVHGGLAARGGELKGFTIAGEDKSFLPANAEIEGDTVVVWNDQIREPTSVRYAWHDDPVCNLFNREGLPASPFRTDDWPLVSEGRVSAPWYIQHYGSSPSTVERAETE